MPDDNRFTGVSDAEKEELDAADAEAESETEDGDADEQPAGGPAFEFDATTAKSIYVRPDTLEALEDAEFEVEMLLRREHDIRDVTGREFHDAAVQVVAEHAEEVVEQVLDERDSA